MNVSVIHTLNTHVNNSEVMNSKEDVAVRQNVFVVSSTVSSDTTNRTKDSRILTKTVE